MPSKVIPQEHRDGMVAAYIAGSSSTEAAALYGYSIHACLFALKQAGIPLRSLSESLRKYTVDETFFDRIDSEEKAYWLGFITADGTVGARYIKLSLQIGDREHLLKFKTSIQSNHPIIVRKSSLNGKIYSHVHLHITSFRLVCALNRLGVENNKSFTVQPCEYVPEHLLPHYWRGIFDGDGSVFLQGQRTKSGHPKWTVKLVGNEKIVSGFATFIHSFIPDVTTTIRPHFRIYAKLYAGVELPQKVTKVLYHDAKIFLDRKKSIVDDITNATIRRLDRTGITKEQLETLYAEHHSWVAVAEALQVSIRHIHERKRLLGMMS